MNCFERTTGCGLVDEKFLNKVITLSGWVNKRRDHGNLIFIDLRDRYGVTQIVFDPKKKELFKQAELLLKMVRKLVVLLIRKNPKILS